MRLFHRDDLGCAKDTPRLLKLRRVRELLLTVLANEHFNWVLIVLLAEKRRRFASDILALKKELYEGALRIK